MSRRFAAPVVVLACAACTPQDVVVFETGSGGGAGGIGGAPPVETGGTLVGAAGEAASMDAGSTCRAKGDCPGQFCSKRSCRDPQGMCAPLPVLCDNTLQPVCGCDHITYWNDCLRQQYGVSSSIGGDCGSNGFGSLSCDGRDDCGVPGAFCAHLLPPMVGCSSQVRPQCTIIPANCETAADPLRWVECMPPGGQPPGGPPPCVSTCDAIQSARTFTPVPPGAPCRLVSFP
jgi:hypothetical protein